MPDSSDEITNTAVVLTHGLFRNGLDIALYQYQLGQVGYHTYVFNYQSVNKSPEENAGQLNEFVQKIPYPVVHFIGHSLGGIVFRYLFHQFPEQREGRVVTLATPHRGSKAAHYFEQTAPGNLFLGKSYDNGLSGDIPPWPGTHELGIIAGTKSLGLGSIIAPLETPNDGTVSVAETQLENSTDHIQLPVCHFGILFSQAAINQSAYFLQHGKFY